MCVLWAQCYKKDIKAQVPTWGTPSHWPPWQLTWRAAISGLSAHRAVPSWKPWGWWEVTFLAAFPLHFDAQTCPMLSAMQHGGLHPGNQLWMLQGASSNEESSYLSLSLGLRSLQQPNALKFSIIDIFRLCNCSYHLVTFKFISGYCYSFDQRILKDCIGTCQYSIYLWKPSAFQKKKKKKRQ